MAVWYRSSDGLIKGPFHEIILDSYGRVIGVDKSDRGDSETEIAILPTNSANFGTITSEQPSDP